jgi:hypothetical protein
MFLGGLCGIVPAVRCAMMMALVLPSRSEMLAGTLIMTSSAGIGGTL